MPEKFSCPNCGGASFQEIVNTPRANFIDVVDVVDGKPVFSDCPWDSTSLEGDEHLHYECCSCHHPIDAYEKPEAPAQIDPLTYAAVAVHGPEIPALEHFNGTEDGQLRTILAFSQQPHADPIYEGAFKDVAEFVSGHQQLESHPTYAIDISQPTKTAYLPFTTSITVFAGDDLADYMDVDDLAVVDNKSDSEDS